MAFLQMTLESLLPLNNTEHGGKFFLSQGRVIMKGPWFTFILVLFIVIIPNFILVFRIVYWIFSPVVECIYCEEYFISLIVLESKNSDLVHL